jgi:peptide/nickel transport system permease protein
MHDSTEISTAIDFNKQGSSASEITFKRESRLKEIWSRMKRNKIAMVGLMMFTVIMLCMIFADLIVDYNFALEQNIEVRLQTPNKEHFFGTDIYGRDIFARIIHGSRSSLFMGIVAVVIGITVGGVLAAVAGYFGGMIDAVIMRVVDTLMCIPFMLMSLAIVAALGPGLTNVLIALTVAMVPGYTRVVRSAILTLVGQDFVEAAKSCGTPNRFIILKHILPNAIGTVIVQATMSVGTMIIAAAGMSFLGLGIQPPTPEWGAMLAQGKDYMMPFPHLVIFPGLAICITALSLNLMGDGLRDALDPRLKD